MSTKYCLAFVAAVTCLSTILLSSETDAQPTVDETASCSSSTLEEMHRKITTKLNFLSSNQEEIKNLLASKVSNASYAVQPFKQALVSALVSNCVPLLIQQNVDGSDFFNRSWAEFKVGFNDTRGNYWLGNEQLSQLTLSRRYKLRFDLQSRANQSNWYFAEYTSFLVLIEAYNYTLHVSGFSGNASQDSFSYHDGMMFTTYDRENDVDGRHNCAAVWGGGFWHKTCAYCNVNSLRGTPDDFSWFGLPGGRELQSSRMWLQCK